MSIVKAWFAGGYHNKKEAVKAASSLLNVEFSGIYVKWN